MYEPLTRSQHDLGTDRLKRTWLDAVELHPSTDDTDAAVARELTDQVVAYQSFSVQPDALIRSTVKLVDLGLLIPDREFDAASLLGSGVEYRLNIPA